MKYPINDLFKKKLTGLFFCLFTSIFYGQNASTFTTVLDGGDFTAITVDQNNNVWAGTNQAGLYFLDQSIKKNKFKPLVIGNDPPVSQLRIQSLASDRSGNVWVGHGGINYSSQQGGAERININTFEVQHLSPDANGKSLNFVQRDGLGTRNSQQIVVDKNNTVWIAQKYSDITTPPHYRVIPGTFSYRKADAYTGVFTSVGTWKDYREKNDSIFPYPEYTYDPPATSTPSTRSCYAISAHFDSISKRTNIWVSVASYTSISQGAFPSRLLNFNMDSNGKMKVGSGYTIKDAKFSLGATLNYFNGVFYNEEKKALWATTGISGNGFSTFKDNVWYNINDPKIIPPNTIFNAKAIWGDSSGRVYLGTNKGLIVYDGKGSPTDISSYTLFTSEKYDSPRSVQIPNMLSNNIIAGASEEKSSYYIWLATPKGIMRALILLENNVTVYNIKDRKNYLNDSNDNYIPIAALTQEIDDANIPSFAVDGTTSSVIRYYTDKGMAKLFYKGDIKFKIKNSKGETFVDQDMSKDTLRYGKLELKPKKEYKSSDYYKDSNDLKYVDIIYTHPTYIAKEDFVWGDQYTSEYQLQIVEGNEEKDPLSSLVIFKHPIKFCLPPVLLLHGVWSEIKALDKIEEFLRGHGYSDYNIQKAWRLNRQEPERQFEYIAHIIPENIDLLKAKARILKISAGKVNVVAHSRGGLYTRAYIEDFLIEKSKVRKYNDDINLLITCNTPHAGSPLANAVMDQRIIAPKIFWVDKDVPSGILLTVEPLTKLSYKKRFLTIGDIFSLAVPEKDRISNWGAKNLMVPNDTLSGSYTNETQFIEKLNSKENIAKLAESKVPIHAIATNFEICNTYPVFCSGISDVIPIINILLPTNIAWLGALEAVLYTVDKLPKGLDNCLKYIHGGEKNDLIVPESSMRAGLKGDNISTFPGENILHIDPGISDKVLNMSGVMVNEKVHEKIFELLKEDPQRSKYFTTAGLNPPSLTYKVLPNFKGIINLEKEKDNNEDISNKRIVIDPASVKRVPNSASISFDVYQENIDHMAVICEYESTEIANYSQENTNQRKNTFTIDVPDDFLGKIKITALGFSQEKLVAGHNIETKVGLPDNVNLTGIKFSNDSIHMLEKSTYRYDVLGTFSDGIERRINSIAGLQLTIDNNNILKQIDDDTVEGLQPGTALMTATIGNLSSKSKIIVDENSVLKRTLITDFYADDKSDSINVVWKTLHEYKSKQFILERSEGNNQNFVQINQQAGQGTLYKETAYNFSDTTKAKSIYYKLTLYNDDNQIAYTETIEVNRKDIPTDGGGGVVPKTEAKDKMTLSPNPLTDLSGNLFLNSSFADSNAKINIYDINGRFISTQKTNIIVGAQKINFEMPIHLKSGIYLIQLKTNKYTQTHKLLLQR